MAMTPIEKAVRRAQAAFFKTDEGKAALASIVQQTMTPEAITAEAKNQLAGPVDVQEVFANSVASSNKKIMEALSTSDTPVYVPGGTVQAATAPNYALYAIVAVGLGLLLLGKGKLK